MFEGGGRKESALQLGPADQSQTEFLCLFLSRIFCVISDVSQPVFQGGRILPCLVPCPRATWSFNCGCAEPSPGVCCEQARALKDFCLCRVTGRGDRGKTQKIRSITQIRL